MVVALLAATSFMAQPTMSFKGLLRMPAEWYATPQAQSIADSVMKYQYPSGGWTKNIDWNLPASGDKLRERQEVLAQIQGDGIGATIDNGATITEMQFLAKTYAATGRKDHRKAFVRAFDYLLEAQYANGGWPQFYPLRPNDSQGRPPYYNHITFNDNAMYNVMTLLRDIYEGKAPYDALKLSDKYVDRARDAFERGISCILRCQIKKDGRLTVWCQQHDEFTFAPAKARAYELPSFTASNETTSLIELLMSLPEPSDSIITAVSSAVEWLQQHVIRDMQIEYFVNADGKRDRRLVHHFGSNIWARYYDLQTEEPYVCDRDSRPQPSLEYIGYERRNGYSWYGNTPQRVIDRFPDWLRRVRQPH